MNKPEWKKELDKSQEDMRLAVLLAMSDHDEAEKHRTIHISTSSPTNTDGSDGDIWLIYEA